jgi:hypothetical protein
MITLVACSTSIASIAAANSLVVDSPNAVIRR